jgi:hypothetical protein
MHHSLLFIVQILTGYMYITRKQLLIVSIFCWSWSIGHSFKIWGPDCPVHIENKHNELKQILKNQNNLSLNNWNHIGLIIILVILGILLVLTYCFIRIRYWPLIKGAHVHSINKSHSLPPSTVERPYLIQYKGQTNQSYNNQEQRETDLVE